MLVFRGVHAHIHETPWWDLFVRFEATLMVRNWSWPLGLMKFGPKTAGGLEGGHKNSPRISGNKKRGTETYKASLENHPS